MNIRIPPVAFACCALLSALAAPAGAFPRFLLYQGRYLNDGTPINGDVAMEFRVTGGGNVACGAAVNGSTLFWTSGSTAVATTNGLFSYKLGYQKDGLTADPGFASIDWNKANVTYAIDVCVVGVSLNPKEVIGAGVYSLYSDKAAYAESAGSALGAVTTGFNTAASDPKSGQDGAVYFNSATKSLRLKVNGAFMDLVTGSCSAGTCCLNGQSVCSGACKALQTDTANCGACGTACASGANSSATCGSGACGLTCNSGYLDCDNNASTGCEINKNTNTSNCGACGNVCPSRTNAAAACTSGACGIACNTGFLDCNSNTADGCEVDKTSDVGNCGSCGHVCSGGANGTAACSSGTCGLSCNGGFNNCNGSCYNLTNDLNHCGSCGTACASVTNGAPACTFGTCGIGSCNPGYLNCNGSASDGCEVNGQTNPFNCGTCGHSCSGLPNVAVSACTAGACAVSSCNAGFMDCNATGSDGCEVNVTNNPNNCGTCAHVCSSKVCSSSTCQAATCSDAVKNGNETDVDCGGGTCAACAAGKICAAPGDCASGVCTANVCQP